MADLTYIVSFKGAASPTVRAAFEAYQVEVHDRVTTVCCTSEQFAVVVDLIQDLGLELLDAHLRTEG